MESTWSYLLCAKAVVPVRALLSDLEARLGPHVLQHTGRVATQAARFGLALRLTPAVIEEAILVGWLHEVNRPDTDDSSQQAIVARRLAAERVLRPLPGLFAVSRTVRSMAERWDGRGGPDGLWDTQIPAAGRIVAVANALDELLHGSTGQGGVAPYIAADWLRRESGRRFDPAVVDVSLAMLAAPADSPLVAS